MSISHRVQETYTPLSNVESRLIDKSDDGTQCRCRRRRSVDERPGSINRNDVVGTIGGDIGKAARGLRVVVLSGCVWREVVFEV